mmetsp:Transcript_15316/g.20193  ORF Transcript_15316/g.20193 Transcript_15316/m.20193 type:complete len:157 (-) Transcript_15316:430-900(-)|eukprot:CAMPEP_0195261984 /NCGR_PEP_ID=MMETSP0706-20130129/9483_1 /TAXON_ID=33640 /ORGANISM="Asterionellopsis glacialis, Strain CCMP134" /LENGTH=156 /DNA_ID=CAMNT_0040315975 /DNA_START=12 /DNA_END=482 /DNA_ORIENTATION=+
MDAAALASKFPSLSGPLSSSAPLLGLYFAASWCPDCTEVTPAVHKIYESQGESNKKVLDLVYVASDSTADQMKNYVPSQWDVIPFDQVEERSNLKRHFGACAGKETQALGVDRKYGIPTLIILDSSTGRVITTSGVEDVTGPDGGSQLLNRWKAML